MTARESLAAIGSHVIEQARRLTYLAAVTFAVVRLAIRPKTWRRTVRDVLARQILYSGVEATPFTVSVAFLVGISIVVQAQLWVRKVGQSQLLGPLLVAIVIRELGPLLVNMIVIGRSGNAVAAELGHMKLSGEVKVLDAQGLDPLVYLVVPRVAAMVLSILCLSVIFITVSLFSGYVFALLLGVKTGGALGFVETVSGSIDPWDMLNVLTKSVLPGLLAGVICCTEGLSVGTAITDIPQAVSRAVQRSVVVLFATSVGISVITYL